MEETIKVGDRRSATSMSDLLSPETSSERDSVSIEMKLAKSGRSQNVSAIDSSTNTDAANLPSLGQYHDQQMDQQMDHYDELLLGQFGANLMSSPVFNGNMNFPHMNFLPALSNGIFDLGSNPNTPQLPPMESHIQSTLESAQSVPLDDPILPNMPLESDVANVPPPSDDMNWQMFCQLIGQKNDDAVSATNVHGIAPPSLHIQNLLSVNPMESSNADPIPFAHQSQVVGGLSQTANGSAVTVESLGEQQPDNLPQTKRRKIKSLSPSASDEENASPMSPVKKRKLNDGSPTSKREANSGRGRPRKKSVAIKEEEDGSNAKRSKKRGRKKKSENRTNSDSNDELDMEQFLTEQLKGESFVGIRTEDGEVRIQIPPSSSRRGTGFSKVKFTVFGNACSDKIEDILQPKKRTRYVRGLSEDEKKQRRREQNRNAAARSRARKNAMISKVIQLHQENMGLRAFVAENITQTKILRDEISRLNQLHSQLSMPQYLMQTHPASVHSANPPPPSSTESDSANKKSSLFDIIEDSSLFNHS